MTYVQIFVIITMLGITLLPNFVQSLDEESAKEQGCFPITKTVPVDMEWLASMEKVYCPLMSRLDIYRTAHDFLMKPYKDISEAELYYEGCIYFGLNSNGAFTGVGFNGKILEIDYKPHDAAMEKFEFSHPGDEDGFAGTCYTTMTDNKTYIVNACCSTDNQMTWGVSSSVKRLSKETEAKIHEHVQHLGFKKEYFTALRYESCLENGSEEGVKEEL